MLDRFINKIKFLLERLLVRGAFYQLAFIASLILLIAILAGISAFLFTDAFKLEEAIWWAFLRLTDPGYLGDDQGIILRSISTFVTICGYVFFMGALIAIMTQWLNRKIKKLESGLTPITDKNHILILGWTNRTPTIVSEIVSSTERTKRFLKRIGSRNLKIVILTEEVDSNLSYELQQELGKKWNPWQITFRTGNPLNIESLERVDFKNASVIIITGDEFSIGKSDVIDARGIKILLSIMNNSKDKGAKKLPYVVLELFDTRLYEIAKDTYEGEIEVLTSDEIITRLIAQNVRHRGLSTVYTELTDTKDNNIFLAEFKKFEGKNFYELIDIFPKGIAIGVVRNEGEETQTILNPTDELKIHKDDKIIMISESLENAKFIKNADSKSEKPNFEIKPFHEVINKRILFLGWNHRVPLIIQEFDSYANENFEIDVLSLVPIDVRQAQLQKFNVLTENIKFTNNIGDFTSPYEVKKAIKNNYDNIVLVGSDRLETHQASDARTILGYLVLQKILKEENLNPDVLVELFDKENEKIIQDEIGEALFTPAIVSHMIAQISLKREISQIYDELFTVGGAEIYFKSPKTYSIKEKELTFNALQKKIFSKGDILLGIYYQDSKHQKLFLNPPKDEKLELKKNLELVVLTTYF
ncbi:MAG: hypothetical protein DWQ06_16450 [Calditrichaeota bacterium]|nr:MAG: hypothetical protein DWQ06_16450 [Calditrichota bacterium]